MKKVIGLMLAVMLLVMLASAAMSEILVRDMYVACKNGKSLTVRSSMSTKDDSNILGYLKYGTKVTTYGGNFNGWTMIDYGSYGDAYVMYRFLSLEKPGPVDPSKTSSDFSTKEATTVAQMNSLVKTAKTVAAPYLVTVRPIRASGWATVRWFPSRHSEAVATYPANAQLTVIAELKDWYQVRDDNTGKVGFIYKSYIQ